VIRSMTGFGDASEQADGIHWAVELRSLNNRFFKCTVRLPDEISGLDAELEAQLRKQLNRGSVTLTVKMRDAQPANTPQINDTVLLNYLSHLETLHGKITSANQTVNIDLTALLALPGVLQINDDGHDLLAHSRPVVTRLTDQACGKLLAMRSNEGLTIAEDFAKQRGVIQKLSNGINARAPEVVEAYHQRLRTRIDELAARAKLQIDEKDLIREIAIFAERADISEEVSRMNAHLEQFDQIINSDDTDPAGRTLDFLTQELLREANTIASKSNDAQISRSIVEIKGAIDRIKEQVQNVE